MDMVADAAGEEGVAVVEPSDPLDHIVQHLAVLVHLDVLVDLDVMSVPWSLFESHKGHSKRMAIEHDLKNND